MKNCSNIYPYNYAIEHFEWGASWTKKKWLFIVDRNNLISFYNKVDEKNRNYSAAFVGFYQTKLLPNTIVY